MVPVLAMVQAMHPVLIVIIVFIVMSIFATALVWAALAISSRHSQEEGIEELCLPDDTADTEQLKRFPHVR